MSDTSWPPALIHINAFGDWQSVPKKAEDAIGFRTYPYIDASKIKDFVEGVIGYWTTSNDCLPSKEEAEEILSILKAGEKQ